MNTKKTIILVVVLALITGSIFYFESKKVDRLSDAKTIEVSPRAESFETSAEKAKKFPLAKEITTPDGFINTDGKPVTIGEYIGKKVILVDFWTYSCINCVRTTPFLNAWWKKYEDDGLVIIGIHTPEFEFEKDYENVKQATVDEGIKFPVVLDNDFSTWTAYKNRYWPRKYLIDIDGYIVYDHIGEGAYEETEDKIKELLAERNAVLGLTNRVVSTENGMPVPVKTQAESPEVYFGSDRNDTLSNGISGRAGVQTFIRPTTIRLNLLYLEGRWDINREAAHSQPTASAPSKIIFKYKAKNVFFVASSPDGVRATVTVDGKDLGASAGEDIVSAGGGSRIDVKEARLYRLVKHNDAEEHVLEISVPSGTLEAFTFTFG